jgi:predicted deacylase
MFRSVLFAAITCSLPAASADFTVGSATARVGQKANGVLHVEAGSDAAIDIPVIVFHGAKPGPVLSLISGSHGTEYASILALSQLAQLLDPAQLSGTVVILPLVNVASFRDKVPHRNPVDRKGMNNYPGKADGTQSERATAAVFNQVILKSDYLIDYHGGDLDENLHPFAYWTKANREPIDSVSRDMLLAFGLRMIITKSGGRSLDATAIASGKPCITVLGGHAGTAESEDVHALIDGTTNVMRHLKMLPGSAKLLENPLWLSHYTVIKGDANGIFYPLVVPNAYVDKGTKLGYITTLSGERNSEVIAPISGVMIYVSAVPTVNQGDNLGYIGELANH